MILFGLAVAASFLGIIYFQVYANIHQIRNEWSSHRCNPLYMPFSGLIDPETGTAGNFQHCMNLMGASVMASVTDALGSQFSVIADMLASLTNPLSIFRTMLTAIRKFVISFATSTLGKASGPLSMFVYYMNKIQDLFRRMIGEGYIAAFFGLTVVSFIEGFVSLVLAIIKGFVYAMLIIAIILAMFQPEILAIVLVLASSLAAAGA
jgi:hypothetical protein